MISQPELGPLGEPLPEGDGEQALYLAIANQALQEPISPEEQAEATRKAYINNIIIPQIPKVLDLKSTFIVGV